MHCCFEHVRNDLNLLRKEEDGLGKNVFKTKKKKQFISLMRRYWSVELKLLSCLSSTSRKFSC